MKEVKPILFREDSSLKRKVVVKANGKPEYFCNCVFIDNKYYCKATETDYVDGTYYVKGTVAVEYDWEKKCDVPKHAVGKMKSGIVSCDNGKPVYGFFTPNKFSNVEAVFEGKGVTILNHVVAAKNGFSESYAHNIFYKFKNDLNLVGQYAFDYKQYSYSSDDDAKRFQQAIDTYAKAQFPFAKEMKVFYPFVKKYTYGVEFEICSGYLPQRLLDGYGVLPCRDGSVNNTNGELVTVPLTGTKGISTLYYLTRELQKRCTVDLSCSMHIHFSGFPQSRIFTLTLYTLLTKIQDELFEMFPAYKKDPTGVKKKNYTKMLEPLPVYNQAVYGDFKTYTNKMYYTLYHRLSEGTFASKEWNIRKAEHPVKVKWDRPSRYAWANFANLMFSKRGTVEFRLHDGTVNSQKTMNWLTIGAAILTYAERNAQYILSTKLPNISLNEVMSVLQTRCASSGSGNLMKNYMLDYIQDRKNTIAKLSQQDVTCKKDLERDPQYKFDRAIYDPICSLF